MKTEEIFYTDGQDIVVTVSTLQVRNRIYFLKNINKHGMAILEPARLPGIIMFMTGVALVLSGMANAFPLDSLHSAGFSGNPDLNQVAQWLGAAFTVLGLLLTVLLRDRYAVRISTEDGVQDAVVSTKREYIREILDAINHAYTIKKMPSQAGLRRMY